MLGKLTISFILEIVPLQGLQALTSPFQALLLYREARRRKRRSSCQADCKTLTLAQLRTEGGRTRLHNEIANLRPNH